ncbi:MAG: hypothetical protein WCK01_02030 [Candidatus Uhrbacteria bacterium]
MNKHFLRAATFISPIFAAALLALPTHAVTLSVIAPTPVSTFSGMLTEYTATFTSATDISACTLYIDGVAQGAMTISGVLGGTAKRSATISAAGSHLVRATCSNSGGSTSFGEATVTVSADTTAPILGAYTLTPAVPVAGSPVTVQSNYDDTDFGSGLNTCYLVVDANIVGSGSMTLSGGTGSTAGTASRSATVTEAGSHTLTTNCYDRSGNFGTRAQTVVFSAPPDTINPVIESLLPTTATQNASTAITVTFSDNIGVTGCKLTIDGVGRGNMTMLSATQASMSITFSTIGDHSASVQCADASLNTATRLINVNVTAPAVADTTNPVVSTVLPTNATVGVAVNIQATVSDNIAVTSCTLEVNGVNQGSMTVAGGLATKALIFGLVGDNAVKVSCLDAAVNLGTRGVLIYVAAAATADTVAPVVTSVNPSTATVGITTTIYANYSDAVGVTACNLYVNGANVGAMDRSGITSGTATISYGFGTVGGYGIDVRCIDAWGNSGHMASVFTVSASGASIPYVNQLIKLACPAGYIDVNHPCKAVYFVGSDSKRHAFPNSRVYFTWYSNFDGVIELNSTALSGIALGRNVNYRPGVRMVKFTTLNKVYAVGRYGTLRWVTTEEAARSLYGSFWNTQIDDIADTFFTDYVFGPDVTSLSTFDPATEMNGVRAIDANLR